MTSDLILFLHTSAWAPPNHSTRLLSPRRPTTHLLRSGDVKYLKEMTNLTKLYMNGCKGLTGNTYCVHT